VHRDIAPDNLVVSNAGKIYLIDFGSANEFVGNATGTLVGKHAYMAPEQIRGKATPQSDIYSLGQTLYFCLEGGPPVPIKSSHASKCETEVEKSMDKVIRACTQLDAANRPASIAQIVAMLEEPFVVVAGSQSA
jgi:serine/threonine protein kinase